MSSVETPGKFRLSMAALTRVDPGGHAHQPVRIGRAEHRAEAPVPLPDHSGLLLASGVLDGELLPPDCAAWLRAADNAQRDG
jgi:hypothetical protein